jgi:uncharacterized protein (DUF1501 family)
MFLSRRNLLRTTLAGGLGWVFSPSVQALLAAGGQRRLPTACILLYMNGGPSHLDTWDPKPGTPTGGPQKAIDTKLPGLRINEYLPRLAGLADKLAVIRSMTSGEDDHDRARYFVHTGNTLTQAADFPDLGSVVAKEWPAPESDLPSFVSIGGSHTGPGLLGVSYAPYLVGDPNTPVENITPPGSVSADRMAARVRALQEANSDFARRFPTEAARAPGRASERAMKFMTSKAVKAFDLADEKPQTLEAYGITAENPAPFSRGCLLARRLIEAGVRCVEVQLDGWDTHNDNFNQVQALNGQLDAGMAALLTELSDRKLLESTLVIWMGEFGRTPTINGQQGRDHWPRAFSAVLAGGGIKTGQVHGATDEGGAEVKDRPVTVPDLFTTLLAACGIAPGKVLTSPEGRPIRLGRGKPVAELI